MLLLCESVLLLHIGFRRLKLQFNSITELAARDQEEREGTEFELDNQKYNSSTYKQNVIK